MSYTLTDPGWPRPNVGGLPVPWVAPVENLGEVSEGRRLASIGGAVCQVCGLSWSSPEEHGEAYALIRMSPVAQAALEPDKPISLVIGERVVIPLDGAVLHFHCMKLTLAMCPHIRERKDLVVVEVPANDADPVQDGDTLRPSYSSGDCIVPLNPPGGPS